jgi:putative phosphoribosyl transferase
MGNKSPVDLTGKSVIVLDDGIATGSTMIAIIEAIRKSKPKEIVIAVPVAPPDSVRIISRLVDEFICLESPLNFSAVGQVYENFEQVSDEEVISYLHAAN